MLGAALAGTCHAQITLPGTDIRSYLTADISAKLSLGGTWIPIDTTAGLVGPYWNVVKLGASQKEGVALGGWGFNGSFSSTLTDVTPVRAVLLEQQSDGTLSEASARLLGNPVTNGAGSVIVADFNGDGLDDLVFPAFNESPYFYKHSTAWISRAGGGFDKLILADNVMNHDARLVTLDGRKKILARSFGGSGNNGNGPGFHVIYSWIGSTLAADTSLGDLGGMSVLAGPFTGNSDNWLIIGDSAAGPGVPYAPSNAMLNYAYRFNAGVLTLPPLPLPKPYFNDKPAYAGFASAWEPYSKTHTSRLWTTDLNQDGLPDILAGQEIWTQGAAGLQKAVFQMLVNRGNMNFSDDTDALAPEFNQDSYIDYSVRFADVDGSGIETIFHSSNVAFSDSADAAKQGQYILVNDGTGRLYAAMHDEFRAMRKQIVAFLNPLIQGGGASNGITPQFIAYRTASGTLNFVAVVPYFTSTAPNHRFAFVNVPLGINLATDFRRDLTIATRNGSKRIRTFAGNDTIRRALSDPDCSIDGGLGTNTVVYPGNKAAWVITKTGDKVTVRPASGAGGTDTLTRIQRAQFDDQTVDLNALATSTTTNYTGVWWNPSESGWGINFNHEGDIIFGTLFTYDAAGAPMWLVMAAGSLQSGTTYSGDLYRTTGPAFNAVPFTPIADANVTKVGTMSVTFAGANGAALTYTVNATSVTKMIQKQVFGSAAANCTSTTASRAPLTNYQDLWWNPAESGWGLNITHQDNTVFGALFTYDASGKGLWLVMSAGLKQADGSYLGELYQTTGPAFNANPFTPIGAANVTKVGTMRLRFSDGQRGSLTYSVNGVVVTKQISRQVFSSPVPACS